MSIAEDTRAMVQIANAMGEVEQRLLAAKKSQAPPIPKVIEAGAPAVWKEDNWHVYFPITTSLKEIWWRQRVLHIPPKDQHPFTVGLGVPVGQKPVDGAYDLPAVKVLFPQGYWLPHIDNFGGCLGTMKAPKELRTLEDYWALHTTLTRHCEGVQLDSLYTGHLGWPEEMLKSIPPEVMEWLEGDAGRGFRRTMLSIFPDNGKEMFELEDDEDEEEERPRCDCADCRRARRELVEEEEAREPVGVPVVWEESGDIWTAEGKDE